MRQVHILKLIGISITVFLLGFVVYNNIPVNKKHEISDWFARQSAPNFIIPLQSFSAREQSDVIGEMTRRHYNPKCYGSLRTEEKISPADDYACWFVIKSAYNTIPARMVGLTFSKGRLSHVRLEFPESSFEAVQDYLSSVLEPYPKRDQSTGYRYKDVYAAPTTIWSAKDGFVITSSRSTENQPLIVLWSSYKNYPSHPYNLARVDK